MTEPVHRTFGVPMSEWLTDFARDLDDIGKELGAIVSDGENGFGLSGPQLLEFVRTYIGGIVDAGGMPLRADVSKPWGQVWDIETKYGVSRDSIVDGVIRDWLALGGRFLAWDEFRFGNAATVRELNGPRA